MRTGEDIFPGNQLILTRVKFVFFNSAKPRRFNHIPIYFDERKERLKKLEAAAKSENRTIDPDQLRGKFKKEWTKSSIGSASKERRKSNIRIALIVGVLIMIAYYLMQKDFSILKGLYE